MAELRFGHPFAAVAIALPLHWPAVNVAATGGAGDRVRCAQGLRR
jgi:hypothetical protein